MKAEKSDENGAAAAGGAAAGAAAGGNEEEEMVDRRFDYPYGFYCLIHDVGQDVSREELKEAVNSVGGLSNQDVVVDIIKVKDAMWCFNIDRQYHATVICNRKLKINGGRKVKVYKGNYNHAKSQVNAMKHPEIQNNPFAEEEKRVKKQKEKEEKRRLMNASKLFFYTPPPLDKVSK